MELTTLPAPVVSAAALSDDAIQLTWQAVEDAEAYQLFEYDQETGLVRMLDRTSDTSYTVSGLTPDTAYSYIVQPFSYTAIGTTYPLNTASRPRLCPPGRLCPWPSPTWPRTPGMPTRCGM